MQEQIRVIPVKEANIGVGMTPQGQLANTHYVAHASREILYAPGALVVVRTTNQLTGELEEITHPLDKALSWRIVFFKPEAAPSPEEEVEEVETLDA